MAVRHGYGKIAGTDALVFAYDTGDTINSYRGEPTVNVIAGTNLINTVAGTYTTNTTVDGVRILENNQVNNSHVMWNGASGFIITCSAGAYITVSAEYKTNCTIRMRFRDNPYDDQYDATGVNLATISEQGVDFNTNGEWKRYSLTSQTSTANPDLWWYLVDYRTNNEFGRVEIRNWQIEVKSHPTPYVNGTRSATQGLLDLTGNNTIDLSNVSFDSNAQKTFDGTDDYFRITDNAIFTTGSDGAITLETVVRSDENRYATILGNFSTVTGTVGIRLNWRLQGLVWCEWGEAGTGTSIAASVSTNTWYHIVGVAKSGEYVRIYVNGELQGGRTTTKEWTGPQNFYVGKSDFGEPFLGDIPVAKYYSRALTAAEVRNNYRHYKTRFGI